jgi:membrane-bound metal-dependent hydrolase YbcI (DUF457 family)
VETYAHSFFTWVLAKHGVKAGRAAGVAGAVGAAVPDLPAIAGTLYYAYRDGRMWTEESLEAIYFSGPFGATGSALHSAVPAAVLLALYGLLGLGRRDWRRVLLWFLLGWAGHTLADFLTHVNDVRPLFWPLSDWTWSSPISYYDPSYYGREFFVVEHGLMLFISSWLLLKRISGRGGKSGGPASEG